MIEIKNLTQTCGACPSQWEFETFEDRMGYVRYRWGHLTVQVSRPNADVMDAIDGPYQVSECLGDEFDGVISWEDVLPHIEKLTECSVKAQIKKYYEEYGDE